MDFALDTRPRSLLDAGNAEASFRSSINLMSFVDPELFGVYVCSRTRSESDLESQLAEISDYALRHRAAAVVDRVRGRKPGP